MKNVVEDYSLILGVHLKTVLGVEVEQVSVSLDLGYATLVGQAELDPFVVYLPPFLSVEGEQTEGSSLTCQYRLNGENEGHSQHGGVHM